MIKSIFKKTILISIATLFIGCTSSSLNVTHDANSNTTMIDLGNKKVLKLDDSLQSIKSNGHTSINSARGKLATYTSAGVCEKFNYYKLPELGRRQFYNSYSKSDVYRKYKNLDCTTEKIDNLEFHKCGSNYIITYDQFSPTEGSLISKSYLYTRYEECFNKIKKLATLDKTKIPDNTKLINKKINFKGTFRTTTNTNQCIKDGTLKLYLEGNNIYGNIYFNGNKDMTFKGAVTYNGNGYDLLATSKNNINIIGYMDKKKLNISGKYSNENCSGRFTLNRL